MPDLSIAVVLVVLVTLVEATPAVRIPIGLLLAIALLAGDADLLPIAALGALGVMIARLSLALGARSRREQRDHTRSASHHQQDALRAQLSNSPSYNRITFLLAALPGVPAGFVFPLLGTMRTPLWPALAGTLIGRTALLTLTAALFAWLGRAVSDNDEQAAVTLGMLAIILLVFRTINQIDWQHRAQTGEWRMRDSANPFVRMTAGMGAAPRQWSDAARSPFSSGTDSRIDDDVIEGELLGEEFDDDDDDGSGGEPPAALPPSGAAPA